MLKCSYKGTEAISCTLITEHMWHLRSSTVLYIVILYNMYENTTFVLGEMYNKYVYDYDQCTVQGNINCPVQ